MSATSLIHDFLREARVPYSVLPHALAYTAQEEAAVMHVPGRNWAKVVVCFIDGTPVEAVLPATLSVNLRHLVDLAGGSDIRIADEGELPSLFPECERGAMPPFGPIFGHAVYVDVTLAAENQIIFNAGTHTEAIVMRWSDFAKTIRPIVGKFAESTVDAVGQFRLSYRE